jgi:hypothetical protein
VEHFEKIVQSLHGTTFREQAKMWLDQVQNRKRKPVAPSTLATWESCLENWLNPNIGDMPASGITTSLICPWSRTRSNPSSSGM